MPVFDLQKNCTTQDIITIKVNGRKNKECDETEQMKKKTRDVHTKHEWKGKWVKFSFSFSHRMLANILLKVNKLSVYAVSS